GAPERSTAYAMRAAGHAARTASSAGSVRHTSPMKRGRISSTLLTATGSGDRSESMAVEYDGSMSDRRGGREGDGTRTRPGPATRAVHGPTPAPGGAMSTPIQHSSTFAFPSLEAMDEAQALGPAGAFYQRYGHPTLRACEERLAALEEAEMALLFPSGMAAISAAFMAHVKAGDHIVALAQTYGGTRVLLEWGRERLGWTFDVVDARQPGT